MKKILSIPIVFLILTLAFTGCKKEDTVYYINSHPQELHFESEGGVDTVAVTSNSAWTVDIPETWCITNLSSVSTSVKTVYLRFSVSKNTSGAARAQDVVIQSKSNSNIKSVITVFQAYGSGPDDPDPPVTADTLTLSTTDIEIPCRGGNYDFSLFSDTTWTYEGSNAAWCNLAPGQEAGGRGEYPFTFIADPSKSTQARTAILAFKTVNDTIAFLHVTQRPLGISVPEDLIAFRDDVNDKKDLRPWMDSDSTVHLLANLDMSSAGNWIPIGLHTNTSNYSFDNITISGVFNGNNHKISNLHITQTSLLSAGMFGYVKMAEIKNLIMDETCSIILNPTQSQRIYAGGICGTLVAGTISNCHFNGIIRISGNSTYTATGGIVGMSDIYLGNKQSIVSNCTNSGSVEGLVRTGGIVGIQYGCIIDGCTNKSNAAVKGTESTGGVCGYSWTGSTIKNSTNYGRVQGMLERTGGVCGSQFSNAVIDNCENKNVAIISGTSRIGGICGYSISSSIIKNCDNASIISGVSEIGGICGVQYTSSTIIGCSNSGAITTTGVTEEQNKGTGGITGSNINSEVIDSSNSGPVKGEGSVGGIAGFSNYIIKECNNLAAILGDRDVGGVAGLVDGAGFMISFCDNNGTVTGSACVGGVIGNMTANASVSFCNNLGGGTVKAVVESAGGILGYTTEYFKGYTVSDCENHASISSEKWAGGIVSVSYGKIKSCLNKGDVTVSITNDSMQNPNNVEGITVAAGGIVGVAYSSIENCENTGMVYGYSSSGIVSRFLASSYYYIKNCKNSGQINGISAGGIVASNINGATIDNNLNYGNVTGSYNVGGIIAENLSGQLTSCINNGIIAGSEFEISEKPFSIGGVCGYNRGGNLTGCSNSGSVTRTSQEGNMKYVGGVLGVTMEGDTRLGGKLTDCSNSGAVNGYYNYADQCYTGGFCGFYYGPEGGVDNCSNTGTVNGEPASDANMYGGTN